MLAMLRPLPRLVTGNSLRTGGDRQSTESGTSPTTLTSTTSSSMRSLGRERFRSAAIWTSS